MIERQVPSSGVMLPVIGLGTWKGFDVGGDEADRRRLDAVLETLLASGGSVVDSSPMYGNAEEVVGDLLAASRRRPDVFVATKVWTRGEEAGRRSIERSMRLMRADPIDLVQVHNLLDWEIHLKTLRRLKDEDRVRHIGITHYTDAAHADLIRVMQAEKLDFVQVNYSATDRAAEERLLPLALDRGIAVIVNVPLGAGSLVRRLSGKPLPRVAEPLKVDGWAPLLLKFVLSHPAVTVAIPGTGDPRHMAANASAGFEPLPDPAMREEIARAVAAAG